MPGQGSSTIPVPRRVLIVGAGPGLGAALARRFGREGFALTLVGRRLEPLTRLADTLRALGMTAETVTADAANPIRFRAVLDDLALRIAPGVVVYNAALIARDGILTSEITHLVSAYAVDTLGAVSCVQAFSPAMCAAGTGTILATGGYPGLMPQTSHASLSLGKAGLRAAMKLAHEELKPAGVHATSVTIGGDIQPGTQFDPEHIAHTYWALHTQAREHWSDETVIGPL